MHCILKKKTKRRKQNVSLKKKKRGRNIYLNYKEEKKKIRGFMKNIWSNMGHLHYLLEKVSDSKNIVSKIFLASYWLKKPSAFPVRAKQEKERIEIQIAKYPLNKFLPQESVQSSVCLFLLIESDIGSYSIA